MLESIARRLDVSPTVAIILLVLIIVQVSTQVYALVDLSRRDTVVGGRKWPWALAIVFANLPGAIVYLVSRRSAHAVTVSDERSGASAAGTKAAERAVDTLYGPRDRP